MVYSFFYMYSIISYIDDIKILVVTLTSRPNLKYGVKANLIIINHLYSFVRGVTVCGW